jgi:thymidine phosphorylase
MRDSGKIFDYRSGLRPRKLVRRYPTGAVSEKAALILPALIAAAAEEVPLASNFLVARSLGFTGGTWDKLSSIDGFTFPRPGAAAEEILRRESVVMCVTSHDVAPCDRIFYQIRSLTGTIESHDLIVASIASKQGALPADSVLLDVRFGDGAFFETEHAAQLAAADITCLLGSWGIRCDSTFTDTSMPGGAAIGNALEVAEAIAIMTGSDDDFWIRPLLDAQWKLVRGFFSNLLRMEFPRCPFDEYESWADEIRRSGKLTRAFIRLLTAHGVEVAHAEELCLRSAPRAVGGRSHSVTSAHVGVVSRIDQKRLGYLVNFGLGGGGNEFGGIRDLRAGCVLRVFLGMTVNKGQTLCELFGNELCISSVIDEVRSCFSVK